MEGVTNYFPGIKEKLEPLVTSSESRNLEDSINYRARSLTLGTIVIWGWIILCLVCICVRGIPHLTGCLSAQPASNHSMPVAHP